MYIYRNNFIYEKEIVLEKESDVAMTKELIKITTNEEGQQLVSAKELYIGLGLDRSNWSRWNKKNILNNDFFEENIDYIGVRHYDEGNETMDFAINLDMAKHLCMMARTENAHKYRKYFIECEKKLRKVSSLLTEEQELQLAVMNSNTVEECRVASASLDRFRRKEIERQQAKLEEQKPKVKYHDEVLSDDGLLTTTVIAKSFDMSARKLNEILNRENVQYKQRGCWIPYAKYDGKGYCKIVHTDYREQLLWTQKGKKFIWELLTNNGYIEYDVDIENE